MIDLMMLCSTLDPFYTGQSFAWLDGYILNDVKQMDCFSNLSHPMFYYLISLVSSLWRYFGALGERVYTHFDWSNFFFSRLQ